MRMFMRNITLSVWTTDTLNTEKGQRADFRSLFYFRLMMKMLTVCVAMGSLLMFTFCGKLGHSTQTSPFKTQL